ncbi:DUF500-domain-containing protein [Martensiomyces pterosporus]|nr:DUF500-domain-containing protein [Martensiomyces pterosporus]
MSRIPLPQSLDKECIKAAKILNSFIDTGKAGGVDKFIPPNILANAKGIAFMTVIKAGFIWSGRVGSGLVVARLPDGGWSAPSAIGTAGAGVGGQIGAEMTDFVMVLNTPSAVKAFSHGGNVTLGGNLSVSAGPLGRSAEASGAIRNIAPVFSYSKSKGLFAGISLEGSVILERKDANSKLYGRPVRAGELLSGGVPPPPQADVLYRALNMKAMPVTNMYSNSPASGSAGESTPGPYGGTTNYGSDAAGPYGGTTAGYGSASPAAAGGNQSYLNRSLTQSSQMSTPGYDAAPEYGAAPGYGTSSSYGASSAYGAGAAAGYGASGYGGSNSYQSAPLNDAKTSTRGPPPPAPVRAQNSTRAVAMYDFAGEQAGDLSFTKGDLINVTKKTESQNDWWEGTCNGRSGQFPANYVRLD